jgi:hypothetical protein
MERWKDDFYQERVNFSWRHKEEPSIDAEIEFFKSGHSMHAKVYQMVQEKLGLDPLCFHQLVCLKDVRNCQVAHNPDLKPRQ